MAIGIVVIIALGVGTHIFEITMKAAATQASLSRKRMVVLGAAFGGIQMLLMLLGLFVTWIIEETCEMDMVNHIYRYAAICFLFMLIVKSLFEGIHIKEFLECRGRAFVLKARAIRRRRARN